MEGFAQFGSRLALRLSTAINGQLSDIEVRDAANEISN